MSDDPVSAPGSPLQISLSHPDVSATIGVQPLCAGDGSGPVPVRLTASATTAHPVLQNLLQVFVQLLPLILAGLLGPQPSPQPQPQPQPVPPPAS